MLLTLAEWMLSFVNTLKNVMMALSFHRPWACFAKVTTIHSGRRTDRPSFPWSLVDSKRVEKTVWWSETWEWCVIHYCTYRILLYGHVSRVYVAQTATSFYGVNWWLYEPYSINQRCCMKTLVHRASDAIDWVKCDLKDEKLQELIPIDHCSDYCI